MFDCLNGPISLQLIVLAKTTKTNLQHVAGCLFEHFTGFMLQALYLLNSLEQRQAERLWLLGIDDWKFTWKIKQNAHSKVMVTSNSFYLYVHREPHHELHLSNCFDVGILLNVHMQANKHFLSVRPPCYTNYVLLLSLACCSPTGMSQLTSHAQDLQRIPASGQIQEPRWVDAQGCPPRGWEESCRNSHCELKVIGSMTRLNCFGDFVVTGWTASITQ